MANYTKNTQWRWFKGSIILAMVFFGTCYFSFEFIEGFSGGFALAFVSFFLAISSLAVAALFYHRSRIMDSILNSTNIFAHWTYSSKDVAENAKRELIDYQERNRALFFIVGGMLISLALIMILFADEAGLWTGLVLLIVCLIIYAVSRLAPKIAYQQALKAPGEAFIAENGIIYEGSVYPFRSFQMRLDAVEFIEESKDTPGILVFAFSQRISLSITNSIDIRIPVPNGKEKEAHEIRERLGFGKNLS